MKLRVFLPLLIIGISIIYYSLVKSSEKNQPTYEQCGVVLNKIDGVKYTEHKHSEEIQLALYMDVRYDNNYVERNEVSANTYYDFNIGDRICFIRHKAASGWWGVALILGALISFFSLILMISEEL
jgi:hypothetical protein